MPTGIVGAFLVETEPIADDRGSFARTFSVDDFARFGIDTRVEQCSASFNRQAGTLRGMHLQQAPFGETKLVRCTRGRVFDVMVDVRPSSLTYGGWFGRELGPDEGNALLIPPGVAHGFLTLEDSSEVFYQISVAFNPDAAIGFRWDDPTVAIAWPSTPVVFSERDRSLRPFAELSFLDLAPTIEESDES